MAADDISTQPAPLVLVNGNPSVLNDERTPLLGNQNGNGTSAEESPLANNDDEQTLIVDEVKGFKLWLILFTCWIGVFLGAIDSTIIATLSAPISSEFRSLSLLSWLATAYFISNAACQSISGRLTDIFGRGPGLVFSNVFFAAGNLICGLAHNQNAMIFGRVVAGIGGGGLMSISTFVGTDLIPLRNRGVIQGMGNICYGAGAMLGGIFGGLVNDNSAWGWRLAFLVQVPLVVVSAFLVAYLVRIPPKVSGKSYLARIDFTGVFSLITFLVLLLLGLNAGGNLVPWIHPLPLTTLPLSLVAFAAFILWESRAQQPIIPVRLLLDRTVFTACMTNLLGTMINMMALFYVPLYMQSRGSSSTDSGVVILFAPIGLSICSIGSGLVMKKTGRYGTKFLVALDSTCYALFLQINTFILALGITAVSLQVASVVILTTLHKDSPEWHLMVAFLLLGSGQGGMLTITLLACLAAVDHSHQAVVTSATYAFRSVGGTVGITIASAIYQNVLKSELWGRFGDFPGAAEEISRIRDDLDELKHLPNGWYDGVLASFMEAFRSVWLTMLVLVLLELVCVSLMRQHKLHSTLSRNERE
ncbi:MFS general substrate transporter [Daldinia caldariorum]|uniref:MFS general substrate transporter n=1 Tax=Daldinia caldariorum TaxID=326644 RepID=UPI0020086F28|nr:MFS general substrate transporter [Daldinia caldariorum]KAI1466481.1 MFS general substrate transporter [Daldinia caldariorum]